MNKKQRKKLSQIQIRYSYTNDLLMAMLDESEGKWFADDGNVLFSNCAESVSIAKDADGALYIKHSSTPELKVPIDDPELIALIDEIRPKTKKVAKKEATPKKNHKNATWLDAFKRVADYFGETRYALYVCGDDEWEDCSEDDEVSMRVCDEDEDRDGEQWLHWDSVKDFLTKPLSGNHCNTNSDGCANIFESVACWECHRYKVELGSPYLIWLIDTIGELGKVNIKKCDTPEKLMKALDKVGL